MGKQSNKSRTTKADIKQTLSKVWIFLKTHSNIGLMITIIGLLIGIISLSLQIKNDLIQKKDTEIRYQAIKQDSEELKQQIMLNTKIIKNYFEHPQDSDKKIAIRAVETIEYALTTTKENFERCEQLKNIKNLPSTLFIKTPPEQSSLDNAKKFEEQGFEFLIQREIDCAIAAFTLSENSSNGFNQVYEIAGFLKKNKSALNNKNSDYWIEIYKIILSKYSFGMPPYYKSKFEEMKN